MTATGGGRRVPEPTPSGGGRHATPAVSTEPVADVPDAVAPDPGPEQRVLRDELAARLTALLEGLPVVHRRILASRILHGLSVAETARAVGATPGAVRVAQHRALQWLRTAVASASLIT